MGTAACGKVTGAGGTPDGGGPTAPPDAPPPPTDFELQLVAGNTGGPGNVNGVGAAARFAAPAGVAVDSSGVVYVADQNNSVVRRIDHGEVTTLAGLADVFGITDGTAAAARFDFPEGIAVDGAGSV
jgi:hypothetical protein